MTPFTCQWTSADTLVGWFSIRRGERTNSPRVQQQTEAIGALTIGALIIVAATIILFHSWVRFGGEKEILSTPMFFIALVVLTISAINIYSLSTHTKNITVRFVRIHEISDFLSSAIAMAAGALIVWTKQYWIDTLASVLIGTVILLWGITLLVRAKQALAQAN